MYKQTAKTSESPKVILEINGNLALKGWDEPEVEAKCETIDDLITLCRADITSKNPRLVDRYWRNYDIVAQKMKEVEEKDRLRAWQPPVRGDEIMRVCGLKPGPTVGKLKKMIEEAILDGKIPNEHDAALEYLKQIKDKVIGLEG